MERESYSVGSLRLMNKFIWSFVVPFTSRKMSSNFVVIGPHHSGKSTLIGRLLYDANMVSTKELVKIDGFKNFMRCDMDRFRFLTDRTKCERERGITIDISRRYIEFKRKVLNFIQVPGNKKYVKNRVAGISQADGALMVISASDYNEERDQILDAFRMIKVSELRTLIVAVTKMDMLPTSVSMEDTFEKIRETVNEFCSKVKFNKDHILGIIPVSAKTGANITRSGEYEWYTGPTLYQIMEDMILPIRECNKPLRITIDKAYTVPSVGLVITGTIIQGVLHSGQYVKIGPSNKIIRVKSLHLAIPRKLITLGVPGDYVGLNVSGISRLDVNRRRLGIITGFLEPKEKMAHLENLKIPTMSPAQYLREAPLHSCSMFLAQVLFFGLNYEKKVRKSNGQLIMHCHNAQVDVSITKSKTIYPRKDMESQNVASPFSVFPREIVQRIFSLLPTSFVFQELPKVSKHFYNLSTHHDLWDYIGHRDKVGRYPSLDSRTACLIEGLNDKCQDNLVNGRMSLMEFRPKKPLAVDTHANCSKLGRFFLRDGLDVFAAGLILKTTHCTTNK